MSVPSVQDFNDHFSRVASDYASFRPHYPEGLFAHISSLCADHARAVDCGTGNGQAAVGLARHFAEVVAIDPSARQIEMARRHDRVNYAVAPAERIPVADASVDLITAAAAAHWFKHEAFHAEVRRVLRPGGILALWTYWNAHVSPQVNAVLERFQFAVVGPWWPPERRFVDSAYRDLPFPFTEVRTPEFDVRAEWTFEHFIGYLGTWSAVERYKAEHGTDPVPLVHEDLRAAWGQEARQVRWPLALRVGRV